MKSQDSRMLGFTKGTASIKRFPLKIPRIGNIATHPARAQLTNFTLDLMRLSGGPEPLLHLSV